MASTLHTSETISAFVVFHDQQPPAEIDQLNALLTIGEAITGFPQTCHGGIVATILDEVMGSLLDLRFDRGENLFMTKYLNVTYLQHIVSPSTILVTTKVTRREGRKLYMSAVIEDEEQQKLAKAEGLFIAITGHL